MLMARCRSEEHKLHEEVEVVVLATGMVAACLDFLWLTQRGAL